MNAATIGALRALGVVVLFAIVNWLSNAANLNGVVSPALAGFISMLALAFEHQYEASGGGALFGAVKAD